MKKYTLFYLKSEYLNQIQDSDLIQIFSPTIIKGEICYLYAVSNKKKFIDFFLETRKMQYFSIQTLSILNDEILDFISNRDDYILQYYPFQLYTNKKDAEFLLIPKIEYYHTLRVCERIIDDKFHYFDDELKFYLKHMQVSEITEYFKIFGNLYTRDGYNKILKKYK